VAPRVTALVAEPRDRVRVELDGAPWRVLPAGAVVEARLVVGIELDRPRARMLGRETRRLHALAAATGALSRSDHSAAGLNARLERRGVAPRERDRAVEALERAGYVDDARFAAARAAQLAARGFGDDGIRHDLERQGLAARDIAAALVTLEPETSRARAQAARLGASPKTARRLAAKGFSADAIESALGDQDVFAADG
jgi:regulatory protein